MKTTSIPYRSAEFLTHTMGLGSSWRFPEKNICLFVRSWLANLAKFTALALILGFLLNGVIFSLFCFITCYEPSDKSVGWLYLVVGAAVDIMAVMFALIALLDYLKDKYRDYRYNNRKNKPYVQREPSLFSQWLEAKKGKFCFELEFIDPNAPAADLSPTALHDAAEEFEEFDKNRTQ